MKIVDSNQGQGRVFSYLRFSSDAQQWGDSERRQEQLAKDWCARRGLTLSREAFADRGVSGWQGTVIRVAEGQPELPWYAASVH